MKNKLLWNRNLQNNVSFRFVVVLGVSREAKFDSKAFHFVSIFFSKRKSIPIRFASVVAGLGSENRFQGGVDFF